MIIGFILCLIGGALAETPIIGYINGENGLFTLIMGIIFGLLFIIPGVALAYVDIQERKANKKDPYMEGLLEALKPGFKEAVSKDGLDYLLVGFRQHYSDFLSKDHIKENEKVQSDVTQIFRNIMQLQKERLMKLGLTCQMVVKRMKYTTEKGVYSNTYSDGKYSIIDVKEEIAARTIYSKDGKDIFVKQDRDIANYTIVQAKKVGEDKIICPNCGVETTREALLDGCDYCGTKFTVEDLGSKIAVFAFRSDYGLRYEKVLRTFRKLLANAIMLFVLAVFAGFTIYGITQFKVFLAEANGGFILTLLADIFAIVISSPVYIISLVIVYAKYIFPIAIVGGVIIWKVTEFVRSIKKRPMLDIEKQREIRATDPNFSLANFYSGVQNKISSVIFADNKDEIQAFAQNDMTHLLGKYSDVVAVDVNHMEIDDYHIDQQYQHAEVKAGLLLTKYNGKKCVTRRENIKIKLIKAAECKTQVVCAPAVLKCQGCGTSLDLLRGKKCPYCGRELELSKVDWVIESMN